MTRLAFRNLFQNKARLVISVGGVGLALMLILALDAVFTGAETQITAYIDHSGADVWVAQEGVRNLHMVSSWLPYSTLSEVASVDGVVVTTPIMYVTGTIDTGRERNIAYIIGLPPGAQLGTPWSIVEGAAAPGRGEVVLDRAVSSNSGLRPGDTVSILGQTLKIVGLSNGTASVTNSVAFISMNDFQAMRRGVNAVSFVLVKVAPDQAPEEVAARIESRIGGVTALTTGEFALQERSLVKDMAADVLTIMNIVGFVIGLAVMSLTVYTATLARRAEYGVLKAVGAGTGKLYRVVIAQAVLSVAMGLGLGLAFTVTLSVILPLVGSNIPLQVGVTSLVKVGSASLVIAALSALLPIRQVAGVDPALVFRGAGAK